MKMGNCSVGDKSNEKNSNSKNRGKNKSNVDNKAEDNHNLINMDKKKLDFGDGRKSQETEKLSNENAFDNDSNK